MTISLKENSVCVYVCVWCMYVCVCVVCVYACVYVCAWYFLLRLNGFEY